MLLSMLNSKAIDVESFYMRWLKFCANRIVLWFYFILICYRESRSFWFSSRELKNEMNLLPDSSSTRPYNNLYQWRNHLYTCKVRFYNGKRNNVGISLQSNSCSALSFSWHFCWSALTWFELSKIVSGLNESGADFLFFAAFDDGLSAGDLICRIRE